MSGDAGSSGNGKHGSAGTDGDARGRVEAARARLERAGESLRAMSFEARLEAVGHVLGRWTAPDSPWRGALAEELGRVSGFHPATLAEGLDAALDAWDPDRLVACARGELDGACRGGRRLAPYSWTAVMSGGAIPMPTILSGLLPLVLGSPVLVRTSSSDPVTGSLLARSVAESGTALAGAVESVAFATEESEALDHLLEAPCVVATGSDATMRSIAARLGPGRRFVAYGHRVSLAVLGPHCADDAGTLERVAASLALDVARWDQSGCLSPAWVVLLGIEPTRRERIAEALGGALEDVGERLPRGSVPTGLLAIQATEREEARMRATAAPTLRVLSGRDWTVVLESESRIRPAPLHRFVRLHPVDGVEGMISALRPVDGRLSSVAVAGLGRTAASRVAEALAALGASRITSPGRLQTPPVDWPHDGMPLLLPMARLLHAEDGIP